MGPAPCIRCAAEVKARAGHVQGLNQSRVQFQGRGQWQRPVQWRRVLLLPPLGEGGDGDKRRWHRNRFRRGKGFWICPFFLREKARATVGSGEQMPLLCRSEALCKKLEAVAKGARFAKGGGRDAPRRARHFFCPAKQKSARKGDPAGLASPCAALRCASGATCGARVHRGPAQTRALQALRPAQALVCWPLCSTAQPDDWAENPHSQAASPSSGCGVFGRSKAKPKPSG